MFFEPIVQHGQWIFHDFLVIFRGFFQDACFLGGDVLKDFVSQSKQILCDLWNFEDGLFGSDWLALSIEDRWRQLIHIDYFRGILIVALLWLVWSLWWLALLDLGFVELLGDGIERFVDEPSVTWSGFELLDFLLSHLGKNCFFPFLQLGSKFFGVFWFGGRRSFSTIFLYQLSLFLLFL